MGIVDFVKERYDHEQRIPWHNDSGVLFTAARAAIEAGAITPVKVWVILQWEESKVRLDSLEAAEERVSYQPPQWISIGVESEVLAEEILADVAVFIQWAFWHSHSISLQVEGSDWPRAKRAEAAALKVLTDAHEQASADTAVAAEPNVVSGVRDSSEAASILATTDDAPHNKVTDLQSAATTTAADPAASSPVTPTRAPSPWMPWLEANRGLIAAVSVIVAIAGTAITLLLTG
ncbi:hypothetical protein OJ998_04710 [Solirubrobacter taibaiensis]|nr:hypothetical protein [Solirubrobacter taibaiensis]